MNFLKCQTSNKLLLFLMEFWVSVWPQLVNLKPSLFPQSPSLIIITICITKGIKWIIITILNKTPPQLLLLSTEGCSPAPPAQNSWWRSELQCHRCILGLHRNRLLTRWKSLLRFPNSQSPRSLLPNPQEVFQESVLFLISLGKKCLFLLLS